MERSGPYGEPYMGPHPPYEEIAYYFCDSLMGNDSFLLSENRKDFPEGSGMNSLSLLLIHLAGVKPPNIIPLSDFAKSRVGPLPTH